jgi:uncharacterized protein with PIN domain
MVMNREGAGALVPGGGRDLETLKREVAHRAERNMPPLGGISADDAQQALATIDSLDRDTWARAFTAVAGKYEDEACSSESHDPKRAARAWSRFAQGRRHRSQRHVSRAWSR